jgi:hypothetical protein
MDPVTLEVRDSNLTTDKVCIDAENDDIETNEISNNCRGNLRT